jgi:DNA modification methylase
VTAARERRSLTHVGGEARRGGQAVYASLLAHALDVESSVAGAEPTSVEDATTGRVPSPAEEAARAHVHGFHTYPARMHPTTAARLVLGLSRRGDTVLDPFCGSGTVLVEARRAGRRALGVDLNPLAVRLARCKLEPASNEHREELVAHARTIGELATSRRKARVGASRRYPPEDVASFDPHVLLELDGLRVGIEAERDARLRGELELVLSSLLVKLSRRSSDTSSGERATRIAAGFPTKSFVRKTEELAARLAEVESAMRIAPSSRVVEGDARVLEMFDPESVDLVVTSPPYAGVYDYVEHHRLRLRWLGLPTASFDAGEIGAKRHARSLSPDEAYARYLDETVAVLRSLHGALREGGKIVWLVADGTAGRQALAADELVTEAAWLAGLEVVAVASQTRPHFDLPTRSAFERRPRFEHAMLLAKAGEPTHEADIHGDRTSADAGPEGRRPYGAANTEQSRGARGAGTPSPRGAEDQRRPSDPSGGDPRGRRMRGPRGM